MDLPELHTEKNWRIVPLIEGTALLASKFATVLIRDLREGYTVAYSTNINRPLMPACIVVTARVKEETVCFVTFQVMPPDVLTSLIPGLLEQAGAGQEAMLDFLNHRESR